MQGSELVACSRASKMAECEVNARNLLLLIVQSLAARSVCQVMGAMVMASGSLKMDLSDLAHPRLLTL